MKLIDITDMADADLDALFDAHAGPVDLLELLDEVKAEETLVRDYGANDNGRTCTSGRIWLNDGGLFWGGFNRDVAFNVRNV